MPSLAAGLTFDLAELFDLGSLDSPRLHLGPASVLASQPEFESGERLKSLISLTEERDLLARAVGSREHRGRLRITIGEENDADVLSDFTLVTAEYRVGRSAISQSSSWSAMAVINRPPVMNPPRKLASSRRRTSIRSKPRAQRSSASSWLLAAAPPTSDPIEAPA